MATINFESVEYEKLTRIQKLALFLITIGPEAAGEILSGFDGPDVEAICRQIATIKIIDEDLQRQVLSEFSSIVVGSIDSALGGMNYAQKSLEMAHKDIKSIRVLDKSQRKENVSELIQEIADMESRQMYNIIKNENNQAIAFLLSLLSPKKCAEIITMLNEQQREGVIERIGEMDTTSNGVVSKVVNALKKHLSSTAQDVATKSGGVRQVADMMNVLGKDISKAILSKIEQKNQNLALAIRKKMFGFEDLVRVTPKDMQRITREIEMGDLVIALKNAKPNLQDIIFKAVSKRAAQTIKDEMQLLGSVKAKEIEAAQDRIIQVVRRLEEEGEITIETGGEGNASN